MRMPMPPQGMMPPPQVPQGMPPGMMGMGGMPPMGMGPPPGMPPQQMGMAPAGYGDDASGSGQGLDVCPCCGRPMDSASMPMPFNSASAPNQPVKGGSDQNSEINELLAALLGSGQGMGMGGMMPPGGGYG